VDELEILKRKLKREQKARLSAENILEKKAKELYYANKELENDRFSLFENSAVGIALTIDGKLINVNERFAQMLGYSVAELRKLSLEDVSFLDDVKLLYENSEKLENKALQSFSMEKRYKRKDGSLFWALARVAPVYNQDKKVRYHLVIIENIQEKKDAKRKEQLLLDELKRSNTELEAFAQMVSHDLKSPLKGIGTLVSWLKEDYQNIIDENGRKNLSEIQLRLTKMTKLIDGIMDYTKVNDEIKQEKLELEKLVQHVMDFVFKPEKVVITKKGVFPIIYANKHKMHQLFQNLIDNAVKFSDPEKGKVIISGSEDKEYYIFKIKDNGKGIPKKYHSKIFKMFTTLEKNVQNSGIGLAIVKNIIDQYGGKVYVESKPETGSTFTFTIAKQRVVQNER